MFPLTCLTVENNGEGLGPKVFRIFQKPIVDESGVVAYLRWASKQKGLDVPRVDGEKNDGGADGRSVISWWLRSGRRDGNSFGTWIPLPTPELTYQSHSRLSSMLLFMA